MNQEQFYRIEAYLRGEMPPTEKAAFEAEIAADPALAEQVAAQQVQRMVSELFIEDTLRAEVKKWRADLENDPAQKHAPGKNLRLLWWVVGSAAAVLLLLLYFWFQQAETKSIPPPLPPPTNETLPPDAPKEVAPPASPLPEEKKNRPVDNKDKTNKPIASNENLRDSVAYIPNPSWEAHTRSGARSEEQPAVALTEPLNDTNFAPDKTGQVPLHFSGTIAAAADDALPPFVLALYDNKGRPLFSAPLPLQKDTAGKMQFDHRERRKLSPGLYYFSIEQPVEGRRMYAGRFTVRH